MTETVILASIFSDHTAGSVAFTPNTDSDVDRSSAVFPLNQTTLDSYIKADNGAWYCLN